MKFYLLTMGHYYYPQSGDKDWIGTLLIKYMIGII